MSNGASDRRLHALRVGFELEQAEREHEIYRLKSVELAGVAAELEALTASLREADEQKSALLSELEKHAREDALTGLYNRRHADERLTQELRRARRFGGSLSVAPGDVDDFKRVNDTFSHATGDEVLEAVARLFRETCREVDTAARCGGEEFALLLPETSAGHAAALCDKVRAVVAARPWHLLRTCASPSASGSRTRSVLTTKASSRTTSRRSSGGPTTSSARPNGAGRIRSGTDKLQDS